MTPRQTLTPALQGLLRLYGQRHPYTAGPLHVWLDDGNTKQRDAAWLCSYLCDPSLFKVPSYAKDRALAYYIVRIAALYLTETQRGRCCQLWRR